MKRIAFLLTLVMLLATCFVGCDTSKPDTNDQVTESSNDTADNETTVSGYTPNNSYDYSIVNVGDGRHYIYIEKWDKFLEMTDSTYLRSEYHPIWHDYRTVNAWIGDETATVATFEYDRNSITVTTHHFNRNDDNVQTYEFTIQIGLDREQNYFMINMLDKDHGYLFCSTPVYDCNGKEKCWPFIRYETTDGGKTWGDAEVLSSTYYWKREPNHMKFITKDVGIFSHRTHSFLAFLAVTGIITTDGGKTWKSIGELPYPEKLEGITDDYSYAEIEDFENTEDGYILKVNVMDGSTSADYIVSFIYDNLETWRLFDCVKVERN
jgi:hypothetical protein